MVRLPARDSQEGCLASCHIATREPDSPALRSMHGRRKFPLHASQAATQASAKIYHPSFADPREMEWSVSARGRIGSRSRASLAFLGLQSPYHRTRCASSSAATAGHFDGRSTGPAERIPGRALATRSSAMDGQRRGKLISGNSLGSKPSGSAPRLSRWSTFSVPDPPCANPTGEPAQSAAGANSMHLTTMRPTTDMASAAIFTRCNLAFHC